MQFWIHGIHRHDRRADDELASPARILLDLRIVPAQHGSARPSGPARASRAAAPRKRSLGHAALRKPARIDPHRDLRAHTRFKPLDRDVSDHVFLRVVVRPDKVAKIGWIVFLRDRSELSILPFVELDAYARRVVLRVLAPSMHVAAHRANFEEDRCVAPGHGLRHEAEPLRAPKLEVFDDFKFRREARSVKAFGISVFRPDRVVAEEKAFPVRSHRLNAIDDTVPQIDIYVALVREIET